MAPRSLTEALQQIVSLLDEQGIAYALAGGMAFSLLVHPRATVDLDLLVDLEESQAGRLRRTLLESFPEIILHERIEHRSFLTLIGKPSWS